MTRAIRASRAARSDGSRLSPTAIIAGLVLAAAPTAALGAVGLGPLRLFAPGSPFAGLAPETTSAALNGRGDAIVGEEIRSGNGTLVTPTVRTRNGARGQWTGTIRLAKPTGDTTEPQVAINERGAAVAVFQRGGRYVAARRRPDAWQLRSIGAPAPATEDVTAVTVLPSSRARFVQVLPDTGCDPGGACMWTASVYDQIGPGSLWTRRDDGLRFGPTTQPVVSLGRRGDILVAWAGTGGSATVSASRRLITETQFEAPLQVSPAGVRGDALAAIGASGDAVVGWVSPDAPGSTATAFTGGVQVAVRRATSPIWASAETVVPAGTPNPEPALAIDDSGNVAVAWTSFATTAGAIDTLRAAIRSAAASQWVVSPLLGSAAIDDGESIRNPRVLIEAGHAFVHVVRHLGPDANEPRLSAARVGGTWSTRVLAGNLDPNAGRTDTVDYVVAASGRGHLLLAGQGLQVRNFDSAATAPAARATGVTVRIAGRQATVRFRLNTASRVFVERQSGPGFRRVGEYPPTRLPAGADAIRLGRLAVGRYRVAVGACSASRGCTVSRFVTFRIR